MLRTAQNQDDVPGGRRAILGSLSGEDVLFLSPDDAIVRLADDLSEILRLACQLHNTAWIGSDLYLARRARPRGLDDLSLTRVSTQVRPARTARARVRLLGWYAWREKVTCAAKNAADLVVRYNEATHIQPVLMNPDEIDALTI